MYWYIPWSGYPGLEARLIELNILFRGFPPIRDKNNSSLEEHNPILVQHNPVIFNPSCYSLQGNINIGQGPKVFEM